MPKRRDLLERLSPDDPNYEIIRHSYLESWRDSHGLVADAFAGLVSVSEYVDRCVHTFEQGAALHVDIEDETSVSGICREIDRMAEGFIRKFGESLSSGTDHLGVAQVTVAIDELSRRVNEIAARSKQQVFEAAIVHGSGGPTRLTALQQIHGQAIMDLSDLTRNALRLIAEAEIEAKYIIRESESSLYSTKAPRLDGEQSDLESDEFSEARNRAARHLFNVTAMQLWERVQPDLDAFKARLNAAKKWVDGKFHPDAGILNDAATESRNLACREVAPKRTSALPKRPEEGALAAAVRRRQQALKEGRLEGYVALPSATQTFVGRGTKGRYQSESPLVRIPPR